MTGGNRAAIVSGALRVYQWPKNLLVFAALLFGQQLGYPGQAARSVVAFVVFCAASSGVYLINDVADAPRDRLHPVKRHRPVARGAVSAGSATAWGLALLAFAIGIGFAAGSRFGLVVAAYIALMLAYTFVLKRVFLVDVIAVASGSVIRAVAGAVVLQVEFTNWLVVCTFFLALFLGLCKRRRELDVADDAAAQREVYRYYTPSYLESLILLSAGSALLNYVIYTCSTSVIERLGTDKLYLTIPFVAYGLFRYLFLVHHRHGGEDPSRTLLDDRPLAAAIVLWGLACAMVIYGRVVH